MNDNQKNVDDPELGETEQDVVEIDIEMLRKVVGGAGAVLLPNVALTCGSYNV